MNISQFFTKKEHISGLSIEDNAVSFLALKRGGWLTHSIVIESMSIEELPPDVVRLGIVIDRAKLSETIRKTIPKKGRGIHNAILTIPTHEIYTTIIPFPASLEDEKLRETVELAIQYQIPFSLEDAYIDWEKIPGKGAMTEVFIAAAPKKVVDEYIVACTDAGISIVAVEFHSMSVLRALPKEVLPVFIADTHHESIAAYILSDQSLRYQTVIPRGQVTNMKEEFRRIADFYESKEGKKVSISTLHELALPLSPSFPKEAIATRGGAWLPVLGAAIRGYRPREDDVYISLLAVGTEEAYALNRALSFIHLIRMGIFTFAIFLLLIYAGTWLTMVTLQNQSNDQISSNTAQQVPVDASEVEKNVIEMNALIDAIYLSILESPHTDQILSELIKAIPEGIIVQNLQWTTPEAQFTMQGTANSREILNNFKRDLQASGTFTGILLPLSNLDQKEKIPFSLTFTFADPTRFYQLP